MVVTEVSIDFIDLQFESKSDLTINDRIDGDRNVIPRHQGLLRNRLNLDLDVDQSELLAVDVDLGGEKEKKQKPKAKISIDQTACRVGGGAVVEQIDKKHTF